jgi:tetratricopeptide (TPR) repeat protein
MLQPLAILMSMAPALFFGSAGKADDVEARYDACLDAVEAGAESALEDALVWASQGGGARAHHCAGMAYVALGQFRMGGFKLEDTAGLYTNRSASERAELFVQAGQAYLAGGLLGDADRVFGFAIQLQPAEAEALRRRGDAALRSGQTDRAIADLQRASELAPGEIDTFPLLANAHLKAGDLDAAERALNQGLAIDAGHIDSLVVRGAIRQARADLTPP